MYRDRLYRTMGASVIWLVVGLAALLAVAIGVLVARYEITFREWVIMFFGAATVVAILIPRDSILRVGLGLGVVSFAFGWRTLRLTADLALAPFEVLIWVLAFVLIARSVIHGQPLKWKVPLVQVLFAALALLGLLIGGANHGDWLKSAAYGKNVLLLLPCFFVVQNLAPDYKTWERYVHVNIVVALYLSVIGLLLVFAPGVGNILAAPLGAELYQAGDFTRVGFPGWGPLAAWYMILVWALTLGLLDSARSRTVFLFWAICLAVIGAAILGSGQRGAWISGIVGLAVYGLINLKRAALPFAALGLLILNSPEGNFQNRLVSALDSRYFDSSAANRYDRATDALELIRQYPLTGLGFGSLTYVHSDYLEIGAALGLGGLAVFVAALADTGWRLIRVWRASSLGRLRPMALATLVMFVMLLSEFFAAGYVTLAFTVSVPWFFWAMADQFTRLPDFDSTNEAARKR